MARNVLTEGNIGIVLRYFYTYSIFILSVIFSLRGSRTFSLWMDISTVVICFLCSFWFQKKSDNEAYINLFLFGMILDTYTFMPIGLSSFSLLITYKVVSIIRSFLSNGYYVLSFARDCSMFIFLFFTLKWFIFSYYNEVFYNFGYVFFNTVKNTLYCVLLCLIYKKFRKDV
ncbi:MAG: hypothetical protein IJ853_03950 [Rickettsiales bacterium]|nr:hypothetical protein [Rickettsiales bacterium]